VHFLALTMRCQSNCRFPFRVTINSCSSRIRLQIAIPIPIPDGDIVQKGLAKVTGTLYVKDICNVIFPFKFFSLKVHLIIRGTVSYTTTTTTIANFNSIYMFTCTSLSEFPSFTLLLFNNCFY